MLARGRIWHFLRAPSTRTMPETHPCCRNAFTAFESNWNGCLKRDPRGLQRPARAAAATEPIGEPAALAEERSDPTDGRRCSDRCGKAHGAAEGSEELDPAAPRRSKGSLPPPKAASLRRGVSKPISWDGFEGVIKRGIQIPAMTCLHRMLVVVPLLVQLHV